MLPGPSTDFPVPPTYIGPPSDEDRIDVLSEGTEAYEDLPIWEQIALGVTPAGVMADLMMAAKYGRDAIEDVIASRYGDAAVAATMTALATVGFIPGVGDAVKIGGQKLLRRLGVPEPKVKWRPDMSAEEKAKWFKQYSEDPRLGGNISVPRPESGSPLDAFDALKQERRRLRSTAGKKWTPSPHEALAFIREQNRKRGQERWRDRAADKKLSESPGSRTLDEIATDVESLDFWPEEISFEDFTRAFPEASKPEHKEMLQQLQDTLAAAQRGRTYPSENVVDLDQWHGIRRSGIENLVDPRLYKQRRWLYEQYGITDADMANLSKNITDYEAAGNVIGADFSKKLTPQDIRDIAGLPGGRKMEPWEFKNAGGEIDDEPERFELGIDWRDPVDEDWPLEGRDYIVDREGQWIWAHNVEAPSSFRELLEQQQGDEIRLLLGEKLLNSAPSFPLEAMSRMKRTKDLKSATRPRTPTASSILKLLEEGGQAGRTLDDRDFENFMALLEEESS